MEYKDVLARAKETIGPNCKVCPQCNGLACGNTMPGPGSKAPGNGAYDNWKAWQDIKLNMDTISDDIPADTSTVFMGRELSMPLLSGPIGSLRLQYNPTDDICDYNDDCIAACHEAGVIATYGDGLEERILERALAMDGQHGNLAIPIINPHMMDKVMAQMEKVKAARPFAAALVVDSAGLPHLKGTGRIAGRKSVEQLWEIKEYLQMPFMVKGIMTAKGAEKAIEAGADAIIVSNHGGRVLPGTPATAQVLPEIAKAVEGRCSIVVDGGIRSGVDIFKALALGADAVMICRPFLISWYGGGKEGILCYINKLQKELADAMYMCSANKISDITADMIRI